MFSLFVSELNRRWRGILLWGIGLGLFGAMYVGLYPSFADAIPALSGLSIYRIIGVDMGTFEGYIASVVINILPVLLLVFVVTASTDTLAGEEDRGTLEMLMAMPLYRWQIVVIKALVVALSALGILLIASTIAGFTLGWVKTQIEVDATISQFFIALTSSWFLMLAFTTIGMFFASIVPDRRTAVAIMTTIVVASFFGENVTQMIESTEQFKYLSLFYYVDTTSAVFREGVQLSNVLVLLVVAGIFFALALWGFQRRDVTTGAWFWQRPQPPAKGASVSELKKQMN